MPDMMVPGALICEVAQIHRRPAVDTSPSGIHPVELRLNVEGYVFSGEESFFGSFFDSRINWPSLFIFAAFRKLSFNFSVCLALRYASRSMIFMALFGGFLLVFFECFL